MEIEVYGLIDLCGLISLFIVYDLKEWKRLLRKHIGEWAGKAAECLSNLLNILSTGNSRVGLLRQFCISCLNLLSHPDNIFLEVEDQKFSEEKKTR